MVPVVVRDVQLLPPRSVAAAAAAAAAVDPPHRLTDLVDDNGNAAEAGKRNDGVICSVRSKIT